jgi:hypothetical protein
MPGLVARPARSVYAAQMPSVVVSTTTRTGMHKQGSPTTDTVGHTGHHLMRVVVDGMTQPRLRYGFWGWLGAEALPAQTLLIDTKVVLPSGTILSVTFGGNSTLTVTTDGVNKPYYDSNVIAGLSPSRGANLYVRTFCRAQSGTVNFGTSWYSGTDSLSWYQTGNHLDDDPASPPAAPGPAYNNTHYAHPISLIGVQTTDLPSFFCWGDSNMANSDQFSWCERALNYRYSYMRANSAGAALASGTSPEVLAQVLGHKYAIIAMGTNNFGQPVGTTLPLLNAAINAFRAQGIAKVLVCTLPPSTTSDEGDWSTASGQHPTAGTSPNREDLNNAIRAMASSPGGSNADAVFDAASYVEVNSSNLFAINGQRWAVKTAPGSPTVGTYGTGPHYEERGMAAAAVGGALAIDRIAAGETGFLQQNPNLGT